MFMSTQNKPLWQKPTISLSMSKEIKTLSSQKSTPKPKFNNFDTEKRLHRIPRSCSTSWMSTVEPSPKSKGTDVDRFCTRVIPYEQSSIPRWNALVLHEPISIPSYVVRWAWVYHPQMRSVNESYKRLTANKSVTERSGYLFLCLLAFLRKVAQGPTLATIHFSLFLLTSMFVICSLFTLVVFLARTSFTW